MLNKKHILIITLSVLFSVHVHSANIPKESQLLLNNQEQLAINYVSNNTSPFNTFFYNNNESSDIIIAIENNFINYLRKNIPLSDVNKTYIYNGDNKFTMLMHSASIKSPHTYEITSLMLQRGADESELNSKGVSALKIAQNLGNIHFINALHNYNKSLLQNKENVLKNSKLSQVNKNYQYTIIKNLKENKIKEYKGNKEKLYKIWFKLIIFGFNDAADLIYHELDDAELLDVNYVSKDGLTPLIASSISKIKGGNVEYANKLISLGANVNLSSKKLSPSQASVLYDNYKVLFLLLSKKSNYLQKDENKKNLIELAFLHKSVKSLYVLKEHVSKL